MVYLDNNATTKTDDRVIEAMLPFMRDFYANPSSSHSFGTRIKSYLEKARDQIADFIGSNNRNIIFTSGATESINLAIKGIAYLNDSRRKKIVYLATEHKAVIQASLTLQNEGYEVVSIPVRSDGTVDLGFIDSVVDDKTLLFSAMLVNNETGVIHPIADISEIVKSKGCYFFCDATQAPGKINFNVDDLKVDMLCFSGHKFYAPKGAGVLYLNDYIINKKLLASQIIGGGQESNFRSGTQNVPTIIGLAKATEIVTNELEKWRNKIGELRDFLEQEILKIEGTKVNGNTKLRVFNTSNICFPNIDSFMLQTNLNEFCVSNGSACNSLNIEPSHVLLAMGLNEEEAFNSIRFSLGKFSTVQEVELAVKMIYDLTQ